MSVGRNRASSVYLVIVAIFTVGIWVIIELGSAYLTAPRDLTGKWRLTANPAPDQPDAFAIDQSGKYLRFSFGNNSNIDVILTQTSTAPSGINQQSLSLEGQGWHITGTGPEAGNELDFKFEPPDSQASPRSGTYRRERIDQTDLPQSNPPIKPTDQSKH